MIDNHIHTKLCKHAEGEVFEYVEKALILGIKEIAFTDHIPLPDNFDLAHRMQFSEIDTYTRWVRRAKEKYPEIKIRDMNDLPKSFSINTTLILLLCLFISYVIGQKATGYLITTFLTKQKKRFIRIICQL